jgi:choline dehydrogenase-like flavoprotein
MAGPLNSFEFGTYFAPQIAMGYVPSTLYNDKAWPDIQTYVHERVVTQKNGVVDQHIYIDHALMRPESYGTVRLASTNPKDSPIIDDMFFQEPKDLERLVDGIEFTNNFMLSNPAFQDIGIKWNDEIESPSACGGIPLASRDYWRCWVRQTSSTHYHPTSSCRMGPNAQVAVVDSKLR